MNNKNQEERSYVSLALELIKYVKTNDADSIITCVDNYVADKDLQLYPGSPFANLYVSDNPFVQMFIQIIEENNVELLIKIVTHENTDKVLGCLGNSFNEYIIHHILNNTKTDILCMLIKCLSSVKIISGKFLFIALEANNVPVFNCIATYAPYREECYAAIITDIIDSARYDWLDILVNTNDTFISDIIQEIIVNCMDVDLNISRIDTLCSRYLSDYNSYSDKRIAVIDFIKANLDVNSLADCIVDSKSFCMSDTEENAENKIREYFIFLNSLGTKISPDKFMPAFTWLHYVIEQSCSEQCMIELLSYITPGEIHIDLESMRHFKNVYSEAYDVINTLIKRNNIVLYIDINNLRPYTKLDVNTLKRFAQISKLSVIGPIKDNQAIQEMLKRNNLPVINLLLNNNVFSNNDVDYLIDYCKAFNKQSVLNVINNHINNIND